MTFLKADFYALFFSDFVPPANSVPSQFHIEPRKPILPIALRPKTRLISPELRNSFPSLLPSFFSYIVLAENMILILLRLKFIPLLLFLA